MASFLKKTFTFLIGAAALPLIIPVSKAFYLQFANVTLLDSRNQLYFLYGIAAYTAVHLFLFKPSYIYNLGHETVHVLSAWLSFGKAGNMKVSSKGGSVETTKSNFFISISPYFIPIYTILLCAAYFLISRFRDILAYSPYFIFFIGFTLAMHIIMTVEALKVSQPDLIKTGYLFALAFIYVLNVALAGFIIGLVFNGFSFVDMMTQFYFEARDLYVMIFRQLFFA